MNMSADSLWTVASPEALIELDGISTARKLQRAPGTMLRWSIRPLSGRLIELQREAGTVSTSAALRLVHETQCNGEPAAWVTSGSTIFLAEDARAAGVDLDGLAVVRAPDADRALRTIERLVRSEGFGVVVLDLEQETTFSNAAAARISRLAQLANTAVIAIAPTKSSSPFGAQASARVAVMRERTRNGRMRWRVDIRRDKRFGASELAEETLDAPAGLR